MPEGYPPLLHNNINMVTSTENRHFCAPDVLELKQEQVQEDEDREFSIERHLSSSQPWIDSWSHTNHESFFQSVTSPSLQAQHYIYKTAKSSKCDHLIDWSTTLPPNEVPGSANNSVGCTTTIPALAEISESGKFENDGNIINENDITMDYSSFTEYSCGITARSVNSHSNTNVFADVCLAAYNRHKGGYHILEDYASQQHEKTVHPSCPPLNSRSQFSAPSTTWADVDHYSKVQGLGDSQYLVILSNEELNLNRGV